MSNPDLYRTYVTQTGFGLEAAAKAAGAGVFDGSVWFVIGDEALDEAANPQTMTDLLNQVRSYPATIEQDNDDPTIWIARVEIPADDGGFFIREAGIRVDDRDVGDLYCYARQAGDYKPELTEGQGKSYTIRLQFIPGNADVINAKIDPSVQFATPTDLNNAINAHVEEEDPHEQYAKKANAQMLPYNPDRTYKQNETCATFNATTGELEAWTSYAPSDNTGHNPQDPANRHDAWANFPTPCWWIKSHSVEPGTPVYWFSDDIPENALQVMDADIDAGFYHRIAKAYPSLVSDGKINLAQILGRYIRIADGGDYVVNTTHEDAIRNIQGEISDVSGFENTNASGVFNSTLLGNNALNGGDLNLQFNFTFDASRVVPTADQNQPQSAMANLIIFI